MKWGLITTGHAMMGLSLGTVTGQAVAELVTENPTFRDLTALNPARFC